MSHRDVLDKEMARRFAWRAPTPGELDELGKAEPEKEPAPAQAAPAKPSEEEVTDAERERWEQAARQCAELAEQVERVWQMTPRARQEAAAGSLLERAEALGLYIVGMRDHPLAMIRLWRLVVRHYEKMPSRNRRSAVHTLSFAPVSPTHRELVDLLVEAAETGDGWLTFLLERGPAGDEAGRKLPELGGRLARILDEGKTWGARETAARWLQLGDVREGIGALRRALRQPHARLRWTALEVLLEEAPAALTAEDVQWLLEDAVKHPLPRGYGSRSYETADGYSGVLVTAVAKVVPPEGHRPLEAIADGEGVYVRKERAGLDEGWALRALAAGYPERALTRIDRELFGTRMWRRRDAVEAAGLLPPELARPRLLEAASGPGPRSADRAKEIWFERFGGECPVDPLAGVQVALLSAPPSEQLLDRLNVLRRASDEAHGAMLEVLLAEAPEDPAGGLSAQQREALALLLFSLREMNLLHKRPDLPRSEDAWAELLFRRFGPPALEGLATIAERAALVGVDHGWLAALASLARKGVLPADFVARLRAIARDALLSPAWEGATAPLIVLSNVGPPPDLLDRLWEIVMDRDERRGSARWRYPYSIRWAADSLVAMKDAPALDARLAAEGPEALRARSYVALDRIVDIGCRRGLPEIFALAARCLAAVDEDPESAETAARCAYALVAGKRLEEAWKLDALGRPESLQFQIASYLVRQDRSPAVIGALEQALTSPARGGAAAAEAADALVWMKVLGIDDPRLDAILERAPERARASLGGGLLLIGAPLAPLRRHYAGMLRSADDSTAERAFEDLYVKQPEGIWELLAEVLAEGPNPAIRESIEYRLGKPSEAELYWRDPGDDEEEDDEDFDDDDDDDDDDVEDDVE